MTMEYKKMLLKVCEICVIINGYTIIYVYPFIFN